MWLQFNYMACRNTSQSQMSPSWQLVVILAWFSSLKRDAIWQQTPQQGPREERFVWRWKHILRKGHNKIYNQYSLQTLQHQRVCIANESLHKSYAMMVNRRSLVPISTIVETVDIRVARCHQNCPRLQLPRYLFLLLWCYVVCLYLQHWPHPSINGSDIIAQFYGMQHWNESGSQG